MTSTVQALARAASPHRPICRRSPRLRHDSPASGPNADLPPTGVMDMAFE